ncbi:hypothetical protein ACP4OV_008333 [Aristida adscensionis]
MELQSLGREMASWRLMGRLKGTLPVRTRQAQSALVRTISASEPQHCCVGDPPPLVLPVTKLKHGVNVASIDAVHDVATCCPAAAAANAAATTSTAAAAVGLAAVLPRLIAFLGMIRDKNTRYKRNEEAVPIEAMGAAAYDAAVRGLALAVAAALLASRCAAQPSPGSGGCTPELVSLSPCMDYMSGNATTPAAPCCSAVAALLRSSPSCLCTVLGGTPASLGIAIDSGRALQLPGACKVQAPSGNQCNAVGAPVTSPAAGATTPGAPAAPTDSNATPAGAGSKATPAITTRYSDGHACVPGTIFVFSAASVLALLRRV